MHEDLRGQVAVVTGGGRGLGLEMASALADQGCRVALVDLSADIDEAATALSERTGIPAAGLRCNVTDSDKLAHAYQQVDDLLGSPSILVNAAGISTWSDAETMSAESWRNIIDVNLTGTFFACQGFARAVFASGGTGVIVNISSMSAFVVNTPQHQAAYNASKAAVDQLTRSLAIEWIGRGIRVNAIAPGYILSDMTRRAIVRDPALGDYWKAAIPAGRMGEPQDLRGLVTLLASDDSRYIVGESIVIDGGYSIV